MKSKLQYGTVYDNINRILSDYPFYSMFLSGKLSRKEYLSKLEAIENELYEHGLNDDQIHLSSRFPLDEEAMVDEILSSLKELKFIQSTNYPKSEFEKAREVIYQKYCHDNYLTYIFPEEERLIYALAHIKNPKQIAVLGSYYGYWAVWALAAVNNKDTQVSLIDINNNTNIIANKNFEALGFKNYNIHNEDVIDFLDKTSTQYDFVLIDAEGPEDHHNSDFQGKKIYFPIIQKVYDRLTSDNILVCHNILFKNPITDWYFDDKINKNLNIYEKFLKFIESKSFVKSEYSTTEGIGVYHKKST